MMNKKIIDVFFFVISLTLIFNNISPIYGVGGDIGSKLVFFPLTAGLIYTIYCQYRNKNVFVNFNIFFKFIISYLVIIGVSLLWGLWKYPYYDLILTGSSNQFYKIDSILAFFDISLMRETSIKLWMLLKSSKNIFLEVIYNFFGGYVIYCWYYNDWKSCLRILCKAILTSVFIIICYSFIEVFYLSGNNMAKELLILITPYFHSIGEKTSVYSWPPVLWYLPQLRSIFAEPSYFGIYFAFCIPFLWYMFNKEKKFILSLIIIIMSFFLFLTQARTGVALIAGELLLLSAGSLYYRDKEVIKSSIIIICITLISFVGCNYFISNYLYIQPSQKAITNTVFKNNNKKVVDNKNKSIKKPIAENKKIDKRDEEKIKNKKDTTHKTFYTDINNYIDNNLKSILSKTNRSNAPRLAYISSAIRVGIDNPFLGVGKCLTPGYMTNYFTEDERKISEVNKRIIKQKELGIMESKIPIVCEYAARFAEIGILGMIIYFMPIIYLCYKMFIKLNQKFKNEYFFFMISFIGVLATGLSTELSTFYSLWLLLGLGFAMCFGKETKEQDA